MTPPRRIRLRRVAVMAAAIGLSGALCGAAAAQAGKPAPKPKPPPAVPTYSSPIAMSRDGKLVWVVNPGDDTVSVIRTDNNTVVRKITVGDEPQSVALDPEQPVRLRRQRRRQQRHGDQDHQRPARQVRGVQDGRFGSKDPDDRRRAVEHRRLARRQARLRRQQRPGHDHGDQRRDAATIIGNVDLREQPLQRPGPQPPLPAARPGGHRQQQAAVRHALPLVHRSRRPAGRRQRQGGRGLPARHQHRRRTSIAGYRPAAADPARPPRSPASTIDATGDGDRPTTTSAFPNQLQSIVIRGNQAYLPNIAASPDGPAAVQRRHAGLRQRHRRRQRHQPDRRERGQVPQPASRRARPRAGQEEAVLRQPWAIAFTTQSGAATPTSSPPAATCWSSSTSTPTAS